MEKALTWDERLEMGVAEKTLKEFREQNKMGCPFCKAGSTMFLPMRRPIEFELKWAAANNLVPQISIPERCLRCGAEWDNVFVWAGCTLTEMGRPMAAPKVKKTTGPVSMPTKSSNLDKPLDYKPHLDKEKPTLVVADGTHPGIQRGT